MSDAETTAPGAGDEGGKKKLSGKKLVLLYILPALLLLGGGGGGAAWYFLLRPAAESEVADSETAAVETAEAAKTDGDATAAPATRSDELVFYDLPQILVNLNSGGKRNSYLKIGLALELASGDDVSRVEAVLPRIIDNFQIYLRELRIEDLNGSAGPMMLKEELMMRIHTATGAPKVNDILFKEMLVQ